MVSQTLGVLTRFRGRTVPFGFYLGPIWVRSAHGENLDQTNQKPRFLWEEMYQKGKEATAVTKSPKTWFCVGLDLDQGSVMVWTGIRVLMVLDLDQSSDGSKNAEKSQRDFTANSELTGRTAK